MTGVLRLKHLPEKGRRTVFVPDVAPGKYTPVELPNGSRIQLDSPLIVSGTAIGVVVAL